MHNNVYPSGKVCLSTLAPVHESGWHPSFTVAEILLSVQRLLNDPNNDSPAQWLPYQLYKLARKEHARSTTGASARRQRDTPRRHFRIWSSVTASERLSASKVGRRMASTASCAAWVARHAHDTNKTDIPS